VSAGRTDAPTHGGAATLPRIFEGPARAELDGILAKYPTKQAALLPALWIAQRAHGWVSPEGMTEVAEVLGLTAAYVKGVVTFYTMYHQHPVGQHFVQVCTTTPCNVCGGEQVAAAFLKATGCKRLGETSPDGQWTVIEVECLGACGFPTPVLVDEDFIDSVTPARVPELVARYAGKA
jgi:NADH dehydrogenase (ubiquinone) flavoprotein 2